MENALGTDWNFTDEFDTSFHNNKYSLNEMSTTVGLSAQDLLDMCVMNIDMPQVSGDIDSVLIAGEYRLNAKKFQPFTITITFRDVLGLKLRDYFMKIWQETQTQYFNDIKSSISIKTKGNLLFESDTCLISSVSQVQLDNSNTQVAEFSVEFQTPHYTNSDTKEFGRRS